MGNKNNKPAIRFQGFTEAWEQRKLGDLSSSFEYGLNAAAKEFDGKNKYIRITDIDDDSREFLLKDITSPDTDLSNAEKYKLSEGDILFARTGASVGKSYIYRISDGLVYYAGFLVRAKIKKDHNPEFVFQSTLTSEYKKFINVTSMRSGQPGVNAQEYSCYEIMIPSKPEQDKISNCLRCIDTLITLHQRKYEKLMNIKKSMLEKMFPRDGAKVPEIRFAGFTDPWEQRKLGELSEIKDSARISNELWSEEGIPYIRASDLSNNDLSGVLFLSNDTYEMYKKQTGAPSKGDVLFNGGGEIGKAVLKRDNAPIYVQGGAVLYARTSVSHELDGAYLTTFFETKSASKYFEIASAGGTMKHFTLKPALEMPILYPAREEQEQIGVCFSRLDNLITLHQRKYEKLMNIKKSMLEKMFV